ncbi:MAG: hypothetical protein ACOH2L_16370 [Devosia sp.]
MLSRDEVLQRNEQRVAWALAHPDMCMWVKDALRGARECDPVEVLNDLEILVVLLRTDCEVRLRATWPEEEVLSSDSEGSNIPRD